MKQMEKTALAVTRWIGSTTSLVIHTLLFIASFVAVGIGLIAWNEMLLVVTTIVSLEAIYLSIFIQFTINHTTESIEEISEDIEEVQEDIGEIQEDVDELQENVEDISEDVEEMSEDDTEEERQDAEQKKTLTDIQSDLRKLMADIQRLQQQPKQ